MLKFKAGDRIVSDKYGEGVVQGTEPFAEGHVHVNFDNGYLGQVYNAKTGKRHYLCGNDRISILKPVVIRKSRAKYTKGRRITSLDDLYAQEFVMWHNKVYHSGWTHAWQMKMAVDAIYNKDGIYVAVRKEKK